MFDKSLQPLPRSFYEAEIGQLTRPNSKGWSLGNCPFHTSKSKKSFAVNLVSGAWCCHGCGRKGDLIGFAMQLHNLSFKQACERLGAWVENRRVPVRKKEHPKSAARLLAEAVVNDPPPRDEIRVLRDLYANANARLCVLRQGAAERYEDEAEDCWSIMALALDDLRLLDEVEP